MTRFLPTRTLVLLIVGLLIGSSAVALSSVRVTTSFDSDWRFLKSDAPGAEKPDFDDAGWRKLDVPHDWSIEGPFDKNNPTGSAGGFLPAGVGWYRKHFILPLDYSRRRVFIAARTTRANRRRAGIPARVSIGTCG